MSARGGHNAQDLLDHAGRVVEVQVVPAIQLDLRRIRADLEPEGLILDVRLTVRGRDDGEWRLDRFRVLREPGLELGDDVNMLRIRWVVPRELRDLLERQRIG